MLKGKYFYKFIPKEDYKSPQRCTPGIWGVVVGTAVVISTLIQPEFEHCWLLQSPFAQLAFWQPTFWHAELEAGRDVAGTIPPKPPSRCPSLS